MKKKFSNIIKGDGKTIIMLYGEVGEGCSVDSSRVVSELFANENQDCKIEVLVAAQAVQVAHNGSSAVDAAGWPADAVLS